MRTVVSYQVETYSGEIDVYHDEGLDSDQIKAMAKRQLIKKAGPLPFGYQHFTIKEVFVDEQ